jgi:D-glycero-D-manno-heptose 1,7-bisphosphate phosphatase
MGIPEVEETRPWPPRAVFLDRDGVLNRALVRDGKPYPPRTLEELEILPGVEDALRRLKQAGYRLIVVTNQPDVARGVTPRSQVEEFNAWLKHRLPIDEFRVCFHDDSEDCSCRKPKPGLLCEAAREWGLDLTGCWMIGDRWRDVEAGQRAGCRTVWIDAGYREREPSAAPDYRTSDLAKAADHILKERQVIEERREAINS